MKPIPVVYQVSTAEVRKHKTDFRIKLCPWNLSVIHEYDVRRTKLTKGF